MTFEVFMISLIVGILSGVIIGASLMFGAENDNLRLRMELDMYKHVCKIEGTK